MPKAPRALHSAVFPPGDLNPHHLVLGLLRVDFEGLPAPPSTPHALLPTGVKAVLSAHGFLVAFIWNLKGSSNCHLEKQKQKAQTLPETWTFVLLLGSEIDPEVYSMLGKYPQS